MVNENSAFDQFPVLQTDRLELLEITQKHINDIFEIFSSTKVTEHYNCNAFSGREEAEDLIKLGISVIIV